MAACSPDKNETQMNSVTRWFYKRAVSDGSPASQQVDNNKMVYCNHIANGLTAQKQKWIDHMLSCDLHFFRWGYTNAREWLRSVFWGISSSPSLHIHVITIPGPRRLQPDNWISRAIFSWPGIPHLWVEEQISQKHGFFALCLSTNCIIRFRRLGMVTVLCEQLSSAL